MFSIENTFIEKMLPQILFEKENFNENMLIFTVATTALSLIPPFRFAGSLALRSTAFLTSTAFVHNSENQDSISKVINYSKVASTGLGLVGSVVGAPQIIVASLVVDIAGHVLGLMGANFLLINNPNIGVLIPPIPPTNFFKHSTVIVIDSCLLAMIVTGSSPYLVAAGAISALSIGVMTLHMTFCDDGKHTKKEIFCYIALTVISTLGTICSAQWASYERTQAHFKVYNGSEQKMTLYDKNGKIVEILSQEEIKNFVVPAEDCYDQKILGFSNNWGILHVSYGNNQPTGEIFRSAKFYDYNVTVLKEALPASEFTTFPVGGNVLTAANHGDDQKKYNWIV